MAKVKSRYAGIGDKNASREANYIRTGHYIMRIDRAEEGSTHSGKDFNVINHTVLHNFGDVEKFQIPGSDQVIPEHRVGEQVSNLMMVQNVAFLPNWKQFVLVAMDITDDEIAEEAEAKKSDPDSILEDTSNEITGEENPLGGVLVEVKAHMQLKKDSRSKDPSKLSLKDDFYTRINYIRRVDYTELQELVGDDTTVARLVPDLKDRVREEAEG